jgi:hypothetical protein
MPLPRQEAGQAYPGLRQELRGEFELSDSGCMNLTLESGTYLVIWPARSEETEVEDRWAVRLPNGQVVAEGDTVVGTGAFTPAAPVLANPGTLMAQWVTYCAPDASEVIVFDSAERGG